MPDDRRSIFCRIAPSAPLWALTLWFLAWACCWGSAQLWFDEVISLNNYCGAFVPAAGLGNVFRNYSLANNHILSNALYWGWLRLVSPQAPELVLRLPSLLCGVATVWCAGLGYRRALGRRLALLCAALFAASPVFLPFAWQIRGYPLSVLLAALTMLPVWEIIRNGFGRGRCLVLALLLALQPLIMPSGAVLAAATAVALALARPRQWYLALFPAIGGAVGLAYYLTVWEQFQAAALDAGSISRDWWTPVGSFCHVLFAFAVHLAVPLFLVLCRLVRRGGGEGAVSRPHLRGAVSLLAGWLLAELAMYLAGGAQRVPFPRNSLLFLPMVSFALLLLLRQSGSGQWLKGRGFAAVLLACPVWGAAAMLLAHRAELRLVHQGDIPQNLLMQQYRGDISLRDFVDNLEAAGIGGKCLMVVSDNDGAVAKWYFMRRRYPAAHVFDRTAARAVPGGVRALNREGLPVFISARLVPEAEQLARLAGYDAIGECIMTTRHRQFYRAVLRPSSRSSSMP